MAGNPDDGDIIDWLDRSVSEGDFHYESNGDEDMDDDEDNGTGLEGIGTLSATEGSGDEGSVADAASATNGEQSDVVGDNSSDNDVTPDVWVGITNDDNGPEKIWETTKCRSKRTTARRKTSSHGKRRKGMTCLLQRKSAKRNDLFL
ncbi:hypothetical protein J6590_074479 [Homalodisca vitripennis]|nr:hypothetical protein J6590_074479 [Homalodisca vitripennis]